MLFLSMIAWWWYPLALTVPLCFYLGLVLLVRRRPRVEHGSAIARLAAPPVAPRGVPHQVSPFNAGQSADAAAMTPTVGAADGQSTTQAPA